MDRIKRVLLGLVACCALVLTASPAWATGVTLPDLGVDMADYITAFSTNIATLAGLLLLAAAVIIGIMFVWKKFYKVAR